jgi:biopolymer transport protein ExbD
MAFSILGGGGGGGRGKRWASPALSEINIIPLVDVVLVLLIIFMLTAHVMEFGLDIQAPQVKNVQDTAEDLPVINITSGGKFFLGEQPVNNINLLGSEIRRRYKNATAVYVRADRRTVWDVVAQVMTTLKDEKFEIKAVTKPEEARP